MKVDLCLQAVRPIIFASQGLPLPWCAWPVCRLFSSRFDCLPIKVNILLGRNQTRGKCMQTGAVSLNNCRWVWTKSIKPHKYKPEHRVLGWLHSLSLQSFRQRMGSRWYAAKAWSLFVFNGSQVSWVASTTFSGCGKCGGNCGLKLGNYHPRWSKTLPTPNWAGSSYSNTTRFIIFSGG